ncbi:MAG: segregation/condensation protein A [Bacillus subtilis]|nr:segregation/condensation protein A [Bacillus subtilis]
MSDVEQPPSRQRFRLKDFEGPLDLLLFLIKKNEVSIYDIPIASITEQYLAYLAGAAETDLDDLTEFYALAATLLYIKSRMLLPVELDLDDEIEDPRRDLVEKLIEYQKYKKLSRAHGTRRSWRSSGPSSGGRSSGPCRSRDERSCGTKIDVWDLLKSFSGLMSGMSRERIIDLYEEVSINEKMALIHELLDARESFVFTDLI